MRGYRKGASELQGRAASAVGVMVLVLVALTGCLTARDPITFQRAPLFGMIYDADNQPVADATVTVNGRRCFQSGAMGRVVIPNLARGTHMISVEKAGHELLELEIEFLTRTQVLYLRMVSFEHLLCDAEAAMSRGRLEEAAELLARAKALDPDDPRARYAGALLDYRRGEGEVAEDTLTRLIRDGHDRAFVHLLLADVSQYLLDDLDGAAESLTSYLDDRDDREAEARLRQLQLVD